MWLGDRFPKDVPFLCAYWLCPATLLYKSPNEYYYGRRFIDLLCLTKRHAMKTYWGSGGIAPHILDLGIRWRWVVSFTPRPLYPKERAPGAHWIGGWVGPRAVLNAVVKRKIPSPRRESNPTTPIVQSVAQRYTDWAITAVYLYILHKLIFFKYTRVYPKVSGLSR
jgi:hypothetical protein